MILEDLKMSLEIASLPGYSNGRSGAPVHAL
jgi:hypothetical protein